MDKFVQSWIEEVPEANPQVLQFISDFLSHHGEESAEVIRNQFRNGYCYYFAHMLKIAFSRGEVCVCAPLGHFVWMDDNQIPYDIEGVNFSECDAYIPESFMGDMVKDFLHISGVGHNSTQEEIQDLINRYNERNMH